jgi:Zn-finger nucleic acid-binding protein
MNKCPVCQETLTIVEYEDQRARHCSRCGGYLVKQNRLELIRRLDRISKSRLKADAALFRGSTEQRLKCPQCFRLMRKQEIDLRVFRIHIDVCDRCSVVWLERGELALVQLAHEASTRFLDAKEFQRRMQELEASPERLAAFQERLASMPRRSEVMEYLFDDIEESIFETIFRNITGPRPYL